MKAAFGEEGKTQYPLGNQKAGLIDVDNGNLELGARRTAVQSISAGGAPGPQAVPAWRQLIILRCWNVCDSVAARISFIETLHIACGVKPGTLTMHDDAGVKTEWEEATLVKLEQEMAAGPFILFRMQFIRALAV